MGINVEKVKNTIQSYPIGTIITREVVEEIIEALAELDVDREFQKLVAVGDIVTLKNGAVGNVHKVVEVRGHAIRIQSLDEPCPFWVENEALNNLFLASKLHTELDGYKVGDVVEFEWDNKIEVGKITLIPLCEVPFNIVWWDGREWSHGAVIKEKIIRKLWPAEKTKGRG